MNQVDGDGSATAPVHPMTLVAATEPAIEAVWPSAACSGGVDTCSEGSGGAADSTHGPRSGGPSQAPAPTSAATAAVVSNNIAVAAAAAAAAVAAAIASCAAAAAAATIATAAVTTGAGTLGNASVTSAAGGASEGEGAAASELGAAATADAVGAALTSSSSTSSGGSVVRGTAQEVEKGDQAREVKLPRSLSAWLKEVRGVESMGYGEYAPDIKSLCCFFALVVCFRRHRRPVGRWSC